MLQRTSLLPMGDVLLVPGLCEGVSGNGFQVEVALIGASITTITTAGKMF